MRRANIREAGAHSRMFYYYPRTHIRARAAAVAAEAAAATVRERIEVLKYFIISPISLRWWWLQDVRARAVEKPAPERPRLPRVTGTTSGFAWARPWPRDLDTQAIASRPLRVDHVISWKWKRAPCRARATRPNARRIYLHISFRCIPSDRKSRTAPVIYQLADICVSTRCAAESRDAENWLTIGRELFSRSRQATICL